MLKLEVPMEPTMPTIFDLCSYLGTVPPPAEAEVKIGRARDDGLSVAVYGRSLAVWAAGLFEVLDRKDFRVYLSVSRSIWPQDQTSVHICIWSKK
ncbi:MAG: hypothetical protein HYS80_00900 [Candidatus Aenigmarchaeota archaeon]|nr:hypothetical protein [Candidatus Aenigmarchaeota archaeon]